jgi:hypothetical protein
MTRHKSHAMRWSAAAGPLPALLLACLLTVGAAGMSGCASQPKKRDFEPVVAQFFLEVPAQTPNAVVARLPRSAVEIPINPRLVLSEVEIANVELVRVDLGLCLLFEFRGDAARGLHRITASNLGRRLIVTLNGKPMGVRIIDGAIADGRLFFFLEMPDDELSTAALNLKKTTQEIQVALQRRNSP